MADISWMEVMGWFTSNPYRPLVLIVLAQNNGQPLDEMNVAGRAGLIHQQMTGEVVETAVLIKQIVDLGENGYIERANDGFRWQMTNLGVLVSRQWVPGDIEPPGTEALGENDISAWRDRIITFMDHDANLAESAGIEQSDWFMTQSQRLVEMHVLNRVLGETRMPDWLIKMRGNPFKRPEEDE
jgi:hypothetical protein